MNSIEAMEKEIEHQLHDLKNFEIERKFDKCLFVGSGDSYVASLAAEYASGYSSRCCYPMQLVLNPVLADNRTVCIVSISGKTRANLLAAQVAKRHHVFALAVTANPGSLLASACDQVVELKYSSEGVATAGTASFASSMAACVQLATKLRFPADMAGLFAEAKILAKRIARKISSCKGSYFILGSGPLFPSAVYGSLKFHEVLGAKAFPYCAEEFCHSPLFSIGTKDSMIIMGTGNDNNKVLDAKLRGRGFTSAYVNFGAKNVIELLFESTFFLQHLILRIALERKLTECFFIRKQALLKMSSDFIYG